MCETALSKGNRLNGTSERHTRGLSSEGIEYLGVGRYLFWCCCCYFLFYSSCLFCLTSGSRSLSWTTGMNSICKGWWEGQDDTRSSTESALEGAPLSCGSCEISVASWRMQSELSGRSGLMCVSYNKSFASPQSSIQPREQERKTQFTPPKERLYLGPWFLSSN